eukprot:Rhum_TRINITY_DN9860_c0_g1::Rhum_TRINITY_DN9860_c0_g1_i1::g.35611::m.35611
MASPDERYGDDAMEKVLRKRRLHREAIELFVTHDPSRMAHLVAIFEEWLGREQEMVDHFKRTYAAAARPAAPVSSSSTAAAAFATAPATGGAPSGALTLRGESDEQHCLMALDCVKGMDVTLRAAVTRLLFSRQLREAGAAGGVKGGKPAYLEAVHLLNYLCEASSKLQEHFGRTPGMAPNITPELALLSTVRLQ